MHIAVTGDSGNFARVLIRHLHARGHTMRGIDRPGRETPSDVCEHRQLDLRNSAAVEDALRGCDGVAHLAAIPGLGSTKPLRVLAGSVERVPVAARPIARPEG